MGLEFLGEVTEAVRVTEILDEFIDEEIEVVPNWVDFSVEVRFVPLEGRSAEVGHRKCDLGGVVGEERRISGDIVLEVAPINHKQGYWTGFGYQRQDVPLRELDVDEG